MAEDEHQDESSPLDDSAAASGDTAVAEVDSPSKMNLQVEIKDIGPCKKHIGVTVSGADIARMRDDTIAELGKETTVPGFRPGKVPEKLLAKRFRKEISDQLKQRILMESLEQVSEENQLQPINEPELDVENLEVPEEGDFEYEFEVEVRPDFEIPDYSGITIRRPVREITDDDVAVAKERFLSQYAQVVPYEGAAEAGDYVVCDVTFTHNGQVVREMEEMTIRIRPTLRFWDAELEGFDELMSGAKADDVIETDLTISKEATEVEMRTETVHAKFNVLDVKRLELPEVDEAILTRVGAESPEQLDELLRQSLERQVSHDQREKTRQQVLEKITESADWDLPEGLVRKHVESALRREMLEMQQAGYSREQIRARENQIRQQSLTTTEQALKEHFVLDKIAEKEGIECSADDIAREIYYMAMQQGENPRKLRSRLVKNGMMENLDAQLRERNVVDFILSKASFEDQPMDDLFTDTVESVNRSITSNVADTAESEDETDTDE